MATYGAGFVLAQSNNWVLRGVTSNDVLIMSTNSNQSIAFGSSNTSNVTMMISSNGFVGIGKSNPAFALDLIGDLNFTGALRQGGTAYVGSQWSNNSTNVFLLGCNVGIGASNATEGLDIRGLNAKVGCNLYVMSNIGIGKSNPGFSLDVTGDINFTGGSLRSNGILYVGSQWSNNGTNVFLLSSNVGIGTSNPGGLLAVAGGASVGAAYSNVVAPSQGLIVQGNVGIGTSNPGCLLSVAGGHTVGAAYSNVVPPTQGLLVQGNVGFGTSNPGGLLAVAGGHTVGAAYSNVIPPTNGLLVQGNTGFGLSNPTTAVDINGTLTVRSNILMANSLSLAGITIGMKTGTMANITTSSVQGHSNDAAGVILSVASNTSNYSVRVLGNTTQVASIDGIGNAVFAGSVSCGNMGMFRNRIINGDFRINQRGAASNVYGSGSNSYNMDRFSAATVGGASYVITQSNVSIAGAPAFRVANAAKVSVASGTVAAGDYYTAVQQVIEGNNIEDLSWGTSNAVNATVSFNAYSTSTAPMFLSVRNGTSSLQPSLAALSNATTNTFVSGGNTYIASASSEVNSGFIAAYGKPSRPV